MRRDTLNNNFKKTFSNEDILRFFRNEMSRKEHILFVKALAKDELLWEKYLAVLDAMEDNDALLHEPTDDCVEFVMRSIKARKATQKSPAAKATSKQKF